MQIYYQWFDSPVGNLFVAADDKNLRAAVYEHKIDGFDKVFPAAVDQENEIIATTKKQLGEYFNCRRERFDLPLFFDGTPFQKAAWNALLKIPYGKVITYSEQAKTIHKAKAVRSVGSANRLNPISIIIPCHRVIRKSGKLAGYAGGLETKKFLIDLEKNQ